MPEFSEVAGDPDIAAPGTRGVDLPVEQSLGRALRIIGLDEIEHLVTLPVGECADLSHAGDAFYR